MTTDGTADDYSALRAMVLQFLAGNTSRDLRYPLESELLRLFGEDDDTPASRMLDRLAQYTPGNLAYLYSDEEMVGHFQRFLRWLDRHIAEQAAVIDPARAED
ncbi:MAG: hypothetical protein JF591_08765 [Lysobacter sp.]|nr:hypothetical protein [Lysobacter sp.]